MTTDDTHDELKGQIYSRLSDILQDCFDCCVFFFFFTKDKVKKKKSDFN